MVQFFPSNSPRTNLSNRSSRRRKPKAGSLRKTARHNLSLEQLEPRNLLALVINPTFAANINSDPAAATIKATINRAIAAYESFISDNITVNITFQEGGGLGGSSGGTVFFINYADYRTALVSHQTTADDTSAIASLPVQTNDPVNGNQKINVPSPLARALGFSAATATDGTITLNTAICNLDRTSTQDSTKFDLQAVTSHEIDEILGFGSSIGGPSVKNGDPVPTGNILPDDLFRYDQNGNRTFDTQLATQAFFSIDGGTTDLARFNQIGGGDWGDWFSPNVVPPPNPTPQIQSAFATSGATPNLGVELRRLDVIGFTLSALNAPVVTAPSDQTATEGAAKPFDLGRFTDPDAAPWGVTVSWGDGSTDTSFFLNIAGSLGTQSHTFAEEGDYTVTVTVTDFTSQSQSKTYKVTVSDPPVALTGGETIAPVEGASSGSVLLATFTDPGGSEAVGNYSADINWGDGTGTQLGAGSITFNGSKFEVRGTHTYTEESAAANPGSTPYTITVTVHHELADVVSTTSSATVSDPPVSPVAAAISAVEGQDTGSVTVATFTDPGGAEPLADYSATINWGDGTAATVGTITVSAGKFTVSGNHTYVEESGAEHLNSDPYDVTVTISHDVAPDAVVHSTAHVTDPPVSPIGGFSFTAVEGAPSGVQTVATFTDPGGSEPIGDYSAMIDWGDGTAPSAGTISFASGTYTVTGSHTFAVGLGLPDDFGNTLCDANPPSYHKTITVSISHEAATLAQTTSDATVSVAPGTAHLAGGNLIVVGTTANDQIVINPVGNTGAVRVQLNSVKLGDFTLGAGGRIVVAGLSGDDNIQVAGAISLPTVLYGGPGDDRLNGGNGQNILVGCDGNDQLTGGNSNDLLIGGDGADRLNGNAGNDILVAANIVDPITHVEDVKFSHLVAALNGGSITADDDGAVDVLTGAAGIDKFFLHYQGNLPLDIVTDKAELAFNT